MLHIAIVRRLGRHILEMFLESPQGSSLLRQRADGRFFKDPKLSDGCCNYGEFPLGFAACTNQKDTFDYLVSKGASLNFTTYEGHNLLHLMVLHSKKNVRSCGFDDEPDEPFEGGDDSESSKADQWCRDMYDHIEVSTISNPRAATFCPVSHRSILPQNIIIISSPSGARRYGESFSEDVCIVRALYPPGEGAALTRVCVRGRSTCVGATCWRVPLCSRTRATILPSRSRQRRALSRCLTTSSTSS